MGGGGCDGSGTRGLQPGAQGDSEHILCVAALHRGRGGGGVQKAPWEMV